MANKILILAESGSGKTYAQRTLDPKSTFYINADQKSLSFKGWRKNYVQVDKPDGKLDLAKSNLYSTKNPQTVQAVLKAISDTRPEIKVGVVDTLSLLMVHSFMSKAKQTGYGKFTDMALDVYNLIDSIDGLRDDLTVVFTAHIEKNDQGDVDIAIPGGKLLKDKAKIAAMFTIVLGMEVQYNKEDNKYFFKTMTEGSDVYKSPFGMFPSRLIDNDMKKVIEYIQKYES